MITKVIFSKQCGLYYLYYFLFIRNYSSLSLDHFENGERLCFFLSTSRGQQSICGKAMGPGNNEISDEHF